MVRSVRSVVKLFPLIDILFLKDVCADALGMVLKV